MKRTLALALSLCLLLSGCGARLDKTSALKRFEDEAASTALHQLAEDGYTAAGAQKMSVGVLKDGRVRFFSFGGTTEDTLFELGRISQLFTGIAMLSYLDPDETAESYFKGAVDLPSLNGREITVRDLATQSAGLADWPDNLPKGQNPCFGYSDRTFLGYLSQAELLYEPGTASRDSAVSLALLGNLMEWKVGGSSVRDVNLVGTRVISRLKLYQTFLTVPDSRASDRAVGHDANGAVASFRSYNAMGTAGAFYSTSYDMMLFAAACMDQISSYDGAEPSFVALAEQALSEQYADEQMRRGYGCTITDLGFGDVAWQASTLGGFSGYFGLCAEAGTAVILLSDTAVSVQETGEQMLGLLSRGLD